MAQKEIAPGSLIAGRYRLVAPLGRGGMGVVIEAIDEKTRQSVAVKFLDGNLMDHDESEIRFRREIAAAQSIKHRNVVQVLDSGVTPSGMPWFAMERLEGIALSTFLKQAKKLSVPALAALGLQALDALDAAHTVGVVHRDVKPANLFLQPSTRMVRLLDFGVARLANDGTLITRTGAAVGTPLFMAPEQIRGEKDVGPPADLYALGVLLYRMAVGRPPFEATNALALMQKVVSLPAPVLGGVPADLSALVGRLLQKEPEDRAVAADIRATLKGLASEKALWLEVARESTSTEMASEAMLITDAERDAIFPEEVPVATGRSGVPWRLILGAAVLIGVGAGVGIAVTRSLESPRAATPIRQGNNR